MLLDFWSGRRGNDSHRPSAGRNPRFSEQNFRNADFWKRGHHEFCLMFEESPFSVNSYTFFNQRNEIPHRAPCARPWIRNEEVLPLMAIEKWRSQGFGVQPGLVTSEHWKSCPFVTKNSSCYINFYCFGCKNGISFKIGSSRYSLYWL